jgi:hypothetical protein
MGGQCSGVFSTRSCWFRDFLSHQWVACALSATPGNVGEDGFTLPGRVFFIPKRINQVKLYGHENYIDILILVQSRAILVTYEASKMSCSNCSIPILLIVTL